MSDTSNKTYRAGIIGLGFIGAGDQVSGDALGQQVSSLDGTHYDALAGNEHIDVVAGSSRDPGRRERFESRTGIRTYEDWRALLDNEELDMVGVATYAPVHAEITAACADRGIRAIYCEKPMATTVEDAQSMLDACNAAGSLLVLNHNRRFNPNYRKLADLVERGGLGELTSASLQWGAGRLGNVGTHMIDALCMLTGRRVCAVSATLDLSRKPDCRGDEFEDPGGWGTMRLDGGLMVTVDAGDYSKIPACITINGTEGRAMTGRDEVIIEPWAGGEEVWPSTREEATSMDRAVTEIVEWLEYGTPFPYSARDAAHTLEAIVALHVSHAHDAIWIELPLAGVEREREVKSG